MSEQHPVDLYLTSVLGFLLKVTNRDNSIMASVMADAYMTEF